MLAPTLQVVAVVNGCRPHSRCQPHRCWCTVQMHTLTKIHGLQTPCAHAGQTASLIFAAIGLPSALPGSKPCSKLPQMSSDTTGRT